MSDACGLLHEYGNLLNMPTDFMHLFEELHVTHCDKEGNVMATAVGWPLLWEFLLTTDTQLEAEARVRKLEELKLENCIRMSTTLLASGLDDKGWWGVGWGEKGPLKKSHCFYG